MNQAVTFGVLFGGGILLTKALTGNSFGEIAKGHAGTVSTTGNTAVAQVASNGVAGVGSAIASGAATASTATGPVPAKVSAMVDMANELVGKPYLWGGGHSSWAIAAGYDCSGFVSAVLHAAGYLSSPQTTTTLPGSSGIEQGPGQYVTIYDNTDSGNGNDHVIIDLAGNWYESGGGAGSNNPTGGVSKIAQPAASYMAEFNETLHPAGL